MDGLHLCASAYESVITPLHVQACYDRRVSIATWRLNFVG